jgi:hypothetical protein
MKDVVQQLQFTAVPPDAVHVVWRDVAPMLERAIERSGGYYNTAVVLDGVYRGALALWVVLDDAVPIAVLTTRIDKMPNATVLVMDWIGGSRMNEWLPLAQKTFEQYGRDNGCTQLHGFGRKGWDRVLRKHGWKPDHIVYKMELTDG